MPLFLVMLAPGAHLEEDEGVEDHGGYLFLGPRLSLLPIVTELQQEAGKGSNHKRPGQALGKAG